MRYIPEASYQKPSSFSSASQAAPMATPAGKMDGINTESPFQSESEVHLQVKCGAKTGIFFLSRLKRVGKSAGKCIRYQEKWITPNEFESVAGVHAKK